MIDWKLRELGNDGEILVFELFGRLDMSASEYLYSILEDHIQDGDKKLVIDCNDLELISSMGLGILMRVHAKMKKHGGEVKLARLHGAAAKAVSLVMLDKILHIYPTVEDAVASYEA